MSGRKRKCVWGSGSQCLAEAGRGLGSCVQYGSVSDTQQCQQWLLLSLWPCAPMQPASISSPRVTGPSGWPDAGDVPADQSRGSHRHLPPDGGGSWGGATRGNLSWQPPQLILQRPPLPGSPLRVGVRRGDMTSLADTGPWEKPTSPARNIFIRPRHGPPRRLPRAAASLRVP